MPNELPKQYHPAAIERRVYERWLDTKAFATAPDDNAQPYVIMMPLPNITGALHMGHAIDNVMQDLLIRWHRMMGNNALWMAGTDHAGIATQAVIEKRLLELEAKTRHNVGREGLIQRIWDWKEHFQKRIVEQQQSMGCSCDWDRQRFTMDAVCARAVRWTFFRLFRDGLIFRGNRLVNWDCQLQTAVADDEIVYETVQGHFYYLRYPVLDPQPGEPTSVVVATTRPESMLGDTGVACHPDPAGALEALIAETHRKLEQASPRDREALTTELGRLESRQTTHLPTLLKLVDMARHGRQVMLPLLQRPMPLICDTWTKPELGSGCVKITPAHDPNDYEVWTRHQDEIDRINILNEDGTLNANAGPYAGLDRFVARQRVVEDLQARDLVVSIEERDVEIAHSDRSKTPIEPYLSKQWFVKMGDVEGGVVCGRGTPNEFIAAGLAQAAIDAAQGEWHSRTGRNVSFHPDPVRYGKTYLQWLSEKRDWCISRQLWWGHRIPVWARTYRGEALQHVVARLTTYLNRDDVCVRLVWPDGSTQLLRPDTTVDLTPDDVEVLACSRHVDTDAEIVPVFEALGLVQDPDVLDTWFSSGLWPLSTLGWPDPESAAVDPGQSRLGSQAEGPDCLTYYYPGSCLVTGRDIITLWVARMVLMGLYNLGDVPFTDVFVHANILDGKGERMSKSKGNGFDPVDIIAQYGADAMRYVLCEMQTGMQDIRLPVQAVSPYTGKLVDLATAQHGKSIFTYVCPETGNEFDVLGTMPDVPSAQLVSDRFEVGRHFCNKLLNAVRFALMNLQDVPFTPRQLHELAAEDRWILSRLNAASSAVHSALEAYNPAAALAAARDFFWAELCDWYLEFIKPRFRDPEQAPLARQVLAVTIDQVLRLLHPFIPYLTERLWEPLKAQVPTRGIDTPLSASDLLIHAAWPTPNAAWYDADIEARMTFLHEVVRAIRDLRSRYTVAPRAKVVARIRAQGEAASSLRACTSLLTTMASLASVDIAPDVQRSPDAATAVVGNVEIYIPGVIDPETERARLTRQRKQLLGRIIGSRRKLQTQNFLTKASPEVVQKERDRLAEYETEIGNVEAALMAIE
ncbi:Valine--tRNA ligase [Candidatus Entotheonellaceae bacterium PAL068K]